MELYYIDWVGYRIGRGICFIDWMNGDF